jgi:hypothetical protein
LTIEKLHSNNPVVARMQDELYAVVKNERYGEVTIATVIGVLEFLKFNLINESE